MFSRENRCHYSRNQLSEVICQLRFPEILAISAQVPDAFQEAIREDYPEYLRRMDAPPPKVSGSPGQFSLENSPKVLNHQFSSADGLWRINLTGTFLSLTCTKYTCWEDFAAKLDKPLAAFIQIYKPAYFQRIGLRYLNFFSRADLELEGTPFSQMFKPCYLGPLAEEDVAEALVSRSTVDLEMVLQGGCRAKIHAGPGHIRRPGPADQEVKFIFDQDLFLPGQVQVNHSAATLQNLHTLAFSIFRGAITQTLHKAMEPNKQ